MKKSLFRLIALSMVLFSANTYSQQLSFNYDAAGNQTVRTWVCVNCTGATGSLPLITKIILPQTGKLGDSTETKVLKRKIVASPNPLVETLALNWEAEEGIGVSNIKVFNMQGNRVHELKPSVGQNSLTIPFQKLPVGTYVLYITFSDKRNESIKVIKQ